MSEKLTPEELGKLVEELAEREEWGGVETLSDAEREARLARSGIDREKASAIGDRVYAKMKAAKAEAEAASAPAAPPSNVIPLPSRARSVPIYASLLVAASVGALLAFQGSALMAWISGGGGTLVGAGHDVGPSYRAARDLRYAASADYDAGRYAECLRKLDEAKALRPGEEEDSFTAALRKKAEAARAGEGGAR